MGTPITQTCAYHTKRLQVLPWKAYADSSEKVQAFAELVSQLLSPEVTKDLPDSWQQVFNGSDAKEWVNQRDQESSLLLIQEQTTQSIIGLMFLHESNVDDANIEVRLGYLIAQEHWGQGYATELVSGLVEWCKGIKEIKSISGGVESANIGSIKVLEKSGFKCVSAANEATLFFDYHFSRSN